MCGIFGLLDLTGSTVDEAVVHRLSHLLRHRGPDAACSAEFVDGEGRVILGHTRLAVQDTSDAGMQPMRGEEDGVHVVFNGEIYNFRELRTQLMSSGHRFRSGTDTEVIVHGYEQ